MSFRLALQSDAKLTNASAAQTIRAQAQPVAATNGATKYGVLASSDAAARLRAILG